MTVRVDQLTAALADRYRIERQLGEGGMATVFLAYDRKHARPVAIKVLKPEVAVGVGTARFLQEIRVTANLQHPHILPLFDSGEAAASAFYVMPYVAGESLRDRLARDGRLGLEEALSIARAVAAALDYAHRRHVVHRDIKPDNVMLSDGLAIVADFGIARAVEAAGEVRLTGTGLSLGTPAYMSPEQAAGEREVDARADIYALGCLLYEMLAGAPPFTGPTAQAVIMQAFIAPAPSVCAVRDDVPAHIDAAIRRAMAKDPADRFDSAAEFGAVLTAGTTTGVASVDAAVTTSSHDDSSTVAKADEGFWIAVLPFKYRGSDPDVETLADGLADGIVSGLSRFSFLRVIVKTSIATYAGDAAAAGAMGRELGARYVIEGNIRQAGSTLRISAQLVDTDSGVHLWAETYERPFRPEAVFDLQDDLVPRIVSTVGDAHGILPHTMSELLRSKPPDQLTPYEAVLRSFGYGYRRTAEEHAAVRAALERAVEQAPRYADAWAMLALVYVEEQAHGYNRRPDPIGRALQAARRAADAGPSNALAFNALAWATFFRKEFQAFRTAAERSIALNPLNSPTLASLGALTAYSGDWERGCALVERAIELNPRHPGWYWLPLLYDAYRRGDYRGAANVALKINLPAFFVMHEALAAAYGQLGERDAASEALREMLRLKPDYTETGRERLEQWFDAAFVEHLTDGLRKAGLDAPPRPSRSA